MQSGAAGPDGPAYVVIALTFALLAPSVTAQGTPSAKDVMRRVEQYVASYGEKASIVVCTERYTQEARGTSASSVNGNRTLVSDFAIVRADTLRGWLGFRDVLDVDGHPVADRDERLARVLMASQGRYDEARRLSDESARYNIGAIERNFNVPTTALFFFVPANHDRFKFSTRAAADGTWRIAFSERSKPTLIRTPEGRSMPSTGTIHVLPESGVVVRTTLSVEGKDGESRGTSVIDVQYARVDALDMWLPASMDESFGVRKPSGVWSRVTGHAEYSNYRTFTTSVRIK
jgi:hypothetical protein